MRKDRFNRIMQSNYKYIAYEYLERMNIEQRLQFKETHNPWVIYTDSDGEFHYIKIKKVIDEKGEIKYGV